VTLRGERAAVVLSAADYDALVRDRLSLVDDLLSRPAWDDALAKAVDSRAKSRNRDVAI
jgi:PHD/YefM family antitoxin component YafN of YafNO toxin-antitoxin module